MKIGHIGLRHMFENLMICMGVLFCHFLQHHLQKFEGFHGRIAEA